MKQIFNYTDYRKYLKDLFENKKREASYFSLRNISTRIGIRSSGYLSMIINGQRNLSDKNAKNLAKALRLTKIEQEYFFALIQFNQAKDISVKEQYYNKLKSAASPTSIVKKEHHIFYEKWYYSAIRELIAIYEITDDNIKDSTKLLKPEIKESEFTNGLKVLIETGLAFKNKQGLYKRSDASITSSTDFNKFTLHKFQKETMNLAIEAHDRFPKDQRELSTVTMSIDSKTYKKIIEKSAQFRKEIMELATSTKNATQAYQLNLQVFPLSTLKEDKNV